MEEEGTKEHGINKLHESIELEEFIPKRANSQNSNNYVSNYEHPFSTPKFLPPPKKPKEHLKGPLRVLRLCLLGILLPCSVTIFILYIRYRVYIDTLYPLAVSDMRMLDRRMSTTWCQSQIVKVNNATFNAFLLPKTPETTYKSQPLSMVRHLVLEDDTKEYWGFYLLKGSVVTLSTCVRWPGASLIVIRGHKHLHECAYIGDDSSEELDEVLEAIQDGTYVKTDQPINDPDLMKRHRENVEFHHPNNRISTKNFTLEEGLDNTELTDDPKYLEKILKILAKNKKGSKLNTQIKQNIEKQAINQINNLNERNLVNMKSQVKNSHEQKHNHIHRNSTIALGEEKNFKFANLSDGKFLPEKLNQSSTAVFQEILEKLKTLGNDGHKVLHQVNEHFINEPKSKSLSNGRTYSKPAFDFDDSLESNKRKKREIFIEQVVSDLNKHDEENDIAAEEDFVPDGIADHHAIINETTLNDKSNSEFWSSFSSSEEALLNCSGLILNLPLTPHTKCSQENMEFQVEDAYLANTISYKIPSNGYYFFVFNSENEIQPNYIRVRFLLEKVLYNISNPVSACMNQTGECQLDLNFFSNEKLVMELPVKEEDLWNEEYVVISHCQPRRSVYLLLVILVPVLVVLFAFQ